MNVGPGVPGTRIERDSALLRVKSLTRVFGRGDDVVRAVDDVSFAVARGQITAVVGESGSGKSTLARLILRLLEPTSGEIMLEGQDATRLRRGGLRSYWRQVQGVFQDPTAAFNSLMPVRRVMARSRVLLKGGDLVDERLDDLIVAALTQVGLSPEEVLQRYAHQLSGGQRQRVMIARALMTRPALLVADEATSMLDASLRVQILNVLADQRDEFGLSVMFITHDIGQACYLADRVVIMKSGRLVETGTVEDVISRPKQEYTRKLVADVPRL
jgi:peptide/nickel transport system ATP-binding protein